MLATLETTFASMVRVLSSGQDEPFPKMIQMKFLILAWWEYSHHTRKGSFKWAWNRAIFCSLLGSQHASSHIDRAIFCSLLGSQHASSHIDRVDSPVDVRYPVLYSLGQKNHNMHHRTSTDSIRQSMWFVARVEYSHPLKVPLKDTPNSLFSFPKSSFGSSRRQLTPVYKPAFSRFVQNFEPLSVVKIFGKIVKRQVCQKRGWVADGWTKQRSGVSFLGICDGSSPKSSTHTIAECLGKTRPNAVSFSKIFVWEA